MAKNKPDTFLLAQNKCFWIIQEFCEQWAKEIMANGYIVEEKERYRNYNHHQSCWPMDRIILEYAYTVYHREAAEKKIVWGTIHANTWDSFNEPLYRLTTKILTKMNLYQHNNSK